jgi:hypothetical protein
MAAYTCPVRPNPREDSEWPRIVQREPDVAAFGFVEFAEGREWHHAAAFNPEPTLPVL